MPTPTDGLNGLGPSRHLVVWLWLLAGLTALLLLVIGRGSAIAAAWLGHQLDYPPASYGVRLERRVTVTAPARLRPLPRFWCAFPTPNRSNTFYLPARSAISGPATATPR